MSCFTITRSFSSRDHPACSHSSLAVCNIDWDHISAKDLLGAFVARGGSARALHIDSVFFLCMRAYLTRLLLCASQSPLTRGSVLFNSFKPPSGVVKSVTVYPSEFGKERMAREETQVW
jgi:hypothetical protein